MRLNVEKAQRAVVNLARAVGARVRDCSCGDALANAIITDRSMLPAETVAKLTPDHRQISDRETDIPRSK